MKLMLCLAGACVLVTSVALADDWKDDKLGVQLKAPKGWKVEKAKDDSLGALAEATFQGDLYLTATLTREEAHPEKALAAAADEDEAIYKDGSKNFVREKDEKLERKPGEWLWRVFKYETDSGLKMFCAGLFVKHDKNLFMLKFACGEEISKHEKDVKALIDGFRVGGNDSTSGPEQKPPKADLPKGDTPKEGSKPAEGPGAAYENPWNKFAAGSWAELKIVSNAGGAETEMTQKQTLVDKGAEELTIKVEGKMVKPVAMDMPPSEMKSPTKGKAGGAAAGAPPKELGKGEETLEVGGKKLACKWVETEIDAGGQKMTSKAWTCDEVPGGVVKVETKGANLTSTMTLVGFEAKK